jgi:Mg2+ and Co2+ transporter CorA
LLLIPFWNIEVDCTDDRSKQEEDLLQACAQASSGVGFCISLGRVIETEDFAQNLHHFVSIVKRQLPILSYRVQRSYALLLALVDEIVTQLVSLTSTANALIKPIRKEKQNLGPLATCPKDVCVMKRQNSNSWLIQCERCLQWFHIRCAGVTKHKAQKDNYHFKCTKCN